MRGVAANAKSELRLALPLQTVWLASSTRSYMESAWLCQVCVPVDSDSSIAARMFRLVREGIRKFTRFRGNIEDDYHLQKCMLLSIHTILHLFD